MHLAKAQLMPIASPKRGRFAIVALSLENLEGRGRGTGPRRPMRRVVGGALENKDERIVHRACDETYTLAWRNKASPERLSCFHDLPIADGLLRNVTRLIILV